MPISPEDNKTVHRLLRILVADDSSVTRNLVRRGINLHSEKAYFELQLASDGASAFEILRNTSIDLAFIDINMPGLTGPELITAMRGTQSESCLTIAMSTDLDQTSERVFAEYGAYHFIQKPFNSAEIAEIFRTFLVMVRTYSILIVDDSNTMRRLARKVFEKSRFSFDISEAGGVEEAIQVIIAKKPQIIITDYHMPGNDGLQLAGAVRNVSDKIAIYMMSTNDTSFLERSAAFVGVNGFLKKPFGPQDVDCIMHKYLGLDTPKFGKTRNMFSFLQRE
ncbi:Two-component response regulator, PleD family, consists of two REC domains and a diguanylate cyclase (GGDEF) domain [Cohaesibacter sp. ES.047]|uniref:response regulator n=1 Tax=Cohaesibacter sp. ES.047 TaxID=1798205 RepID=UPI000BC04B62|nr:response regulator [Cohaesibacter sp. ES.047]SNY92186.1 Two-component response regulator, PleD family, consists of two REC domains and a diguanylate cyclase (GGDEF) domain [Cohaesibacter sp. ES.047]